MPHCIIEHSSDLLDHFTANHLMDVVFDGASSSQLFEDGDIKLRTLSFDHYRSGLKKESFIHVAVKILSGRTTEQRTDLSKIILASIQTLDFKNTSQTVEIIEIETASYAKLVT